MRHIKSLLLGVALLAISAMPLQASITFGLKVIGASSGSFTPTTASITNIGDTVTLQIYAIIDNNDNNSNDEAFSLAKYGFQSTTTGIGDTQGTFGPVTFNNAVVNPAFCTQAVETNGEDVGNTTPNSDPLTNSSWSNSNSNTSFAQFSTGPNPT